MYPGIHNFSEIGKLNKVLLHRPGEELESLTPATLERLLFDDIPYLKVAQEEHDRFAEVLRENGVEVIYYVDEVAKAIADPARQIQLVNDFLNISKIHAKGLRASMTSLLLDMPPKQMVTKMIAGIKRCEVATKQPGDRSHQQLPQQGAEQRCLEGSSAGLQKIFCPHPKGDDEQGRV